MEKEHFDSLIRRLEQAIAFVNGDTSRCKVTVMSESGKIQLGRFMTLGIQEKMLNMGSVMLLLKTIDGMSDEHILAISEYAAELKMNTSKREDDKE